MPPPAPSPPPVSEYPVGSITRIKLHNFLTYSDVEFKPGPRLNVVMGPNGTGKSSIVCAIAIGLGASPKVLGRADNIAEFVMKGTEEAYTEIELVAEKGKSLVIRCDIARTTRGKCKWKMNGQSALDSDVRRVVEAHNVQISNLCTFLPQEKVGEFSAFDDVGLLRETERALGGQALVEEHEALIALEKETTQKDRRNEGQRERLEDLETQKQRLVPDMKLLQKRGEHLEKAELCRKRLLWMKFEERKEEAIEQRAAVKKAEEALKQAQEDLEPTRAKVRDATTLQQKADRAFRIKHDRTAVKRAAVADAIEKIQPARDGIEEIQNSIGNLEKRQKSIETKHKNAQRKVEEAREKVAELEASTNDRATKDAIKALAPRLASSSEAVAAAEAKRIDAEEAMRGPRQDHNAARRDLEHSENSAANKLNNLRNCGREGLQCAQLRAWIDHNLGRFRRPVLGPVCVEVRCESPRHSAMVESAVGKWLWFSFVCQSKSDYDELNAFTAQHQRDFNLVNLQCCEQARAPTRPFGTEALGRLKHHHVDGYMDEFVECDPAVMQTLRSFASIHTTLVGTDQTEAILADTNSPAGAEMNQLLKSQRGFLLYTAKADRTEKTGFALTRTQGMSSRYVQGDMTFISSRAASRKVIIEQEDPSALEAARARVERIEEALATATAAVQVAAKAEQGAYRGRAELEAEKKRLSEQLANVNKARSDLSRFEGAEEKAREDLSRCDLARERERSRKQLQGALAKLLEVCEAAATLDADCIAATLNAAAPFVQRDVTKARAATAKQDLQDRERDSQDIAKRVAEAQQLFDRLRDAAKAAKNLADRDAPLDEALKKKLDELPDSVEELEAVIDAEKAEAKRIHHDPNLVARFNNLEREMEALETQLASMESDSAAATDKLRKLRDPWEKRLRDALAHLKVKFATYMSSLKARGDVEIIEGATLAQWGLAIMVSFRDNSDLQQLMAHVQSGGERSVSTIMFLMALQAHMPSPFRVVDEINQGMDECNERIVFNRIVRNSTGPDAPQYFLITPKLLQGLTDMNHPDVRALVVFNGPWNLKRPGDWDIPKYVEKKRRLVESN